MVGKKIYLIFQSCLEIDDENDEEQQDEQRKEEEHQDYPESEETFEQAADMVSEENNPAGINSFNEPPLISSKNM